MIGISTFCLHDRPLESALEELSSRTGLVEIMDDGLHRLESAELLESFPFRYMFHAPCRSINIASIHEPIRKASVEVIGNAFDIASEVGANVVVHPGYFAWKQERERALSQMKRSLRELSVRASERSIAFFVENMGNWDYFFLREPSELELLDGIGLALDVGHAHLNRCLPGFLEARISHVHLHDNDGKEDAHLAVGRGTIDFHPVLRAIRRDAAVPVLEVASLEGTDESIRALAKMQGHL
ncbi:MAG: sugar phosphate isomerase/epimerase [Methanolinea sp.]|nr:sugar phosphate isomerase/epimerase [Methanolinea sp.]